MTLDTAECYDVNQAMQAIRCSSGVPRNTVRRTERPLHALRTMREVKEINIKYKLSLCNYRNK